MSKKGIKSTVDIDIDEEWTEEVEWEESGFVTEEAALKAEQEAEDAKEKLDDEEERYALLAQAAQDNMDDIRGLLEKVKMSTATKEEMERIEKMNEKMELLKADLSLSRSTIKSHNESMYHDYPYPEDDLYPKGTPGICIESELKVLGAKIGKDGAMNLHFGRINAECDIMIKAFGAAGIAFEINDLDDPQKMSRAVTSSVRKSISRSVTASRSRSEPVAAGLIEDEATEAEYKICEIMPTTDEWQDIPQRPVKFLCNKPISSVKDLKAPLWFGVVRWGVSVSKGTEAKPMLMQRAVNPFAQGESRLAYYGRIGVDEHALTTPKALKVFKEFKKTSKSAEVDRKQYLAQMEVSAIANFLAKEYNATARPEDSPTIRFLDAIVVEAEEKLVGGRYCAEELLPTDEGEFTRYSNNTGHWNEDEINQSLLLFTRFTYEKTEGYLMVTDLQGVRTDDGFILTDPAVLCKDNVRFGGTNLGREFMKKCMNSTNAMLEEYFG